MSLFKLSWKNILYNPLSSFLSVILFALGIGLIIMLLLFNNQLKNNFDKNLAGIDLVIGAKGSPLQLILNSMYHIDAPTGNIPIKEARPFLNPKHPLIDKSIPLSLGDSYQGYRIVGTTHDFLSLYNIHIHDGRPWQNDFDVVIGSLVATRGKIKLGDKFLSTHGLNDEPGLEHEHDHKFKVVGIMEHSGTVADQLILTTPMTIIDVHGGHEEAPIDTLTGGNNEADVHDHSAEESQDHTGHDHAVNDHSTYDHSAESKDAEIKAYAEMSADTKLDLMERPEAEITSMILTFKNRTNFQSLSLMRNINLNTGLMAASPAYEINRLYSMVGVGTEAIRGIAIAIAIVSALSIFISLFNSLKDRQYELALMRVNGATRANLFSLITFEGLLLALLGTVLGVILGHMGMALFSNLAAQSYKYDFSPFSFIPEEIIVVVVALVIGIIAALIPAIRASRVDIHETLSR